LEVSIETKVKEGAGENGTLVTFLFTGDSPILMLVAVSVGCCGSGSYLSLEGGVGENNTLVVVVIRTLTTKYTTI